ncbi:MAG TPA: response regulator transcription factor [Terriglobales bacterium]|nr:response regulator transcription factor [Terriglobales bacterium]
MSNKNGGGAIRVVVAATSAVRRGGLEAMVRADSSFQLSGSALSLLGLDARAREIQPDVVVADLAHPDPQFASTVALLEEASIAVVALIDEPDPGWASRALRAGLHAILPRESSASEILSAIRVASSGLVLLDPEVAREVANQTRSNSAASAPETLEELTPREVEVLRLMAEGFGNKEIASRLGISDHTVKFHISSILGKLGAASRTEAVTLGIRMGMILL